MELEVLDHQDDIILFTGNPAERMRQMQETAPSSPNPSGNATPSPSKAANTSASKAGPCSEPCSASTPTSSGQANRSPGGQTRPRSAGKPE